ncbi:MAG: hypothetical protein KAT05_03550 [Spirochaetes bacterium]|nr:hypothetical protein [Spirochaetota bacterium]
MKNKLVVEYKRFHGDKLTLKVNHKGQRIINHPDLHEENNFELLKDFDLMFLHSDEEAFLKTFEIMANVANTPKKNFYDAQEIIRIMDERY